jgi:hypothetical protein
MQGVSATDAEDGPIDASAIGHTGAVDTSVDSAVFEVVYHVSDSDYNYVQASGYVLVGEWAVRDGYAIDAHGFARQIGQIQGTEAEAIALSEAHAYDMRPTLSPGVANPAFGREVPVVVTDDGGYYGRTAGEYSITLAVKDLPSTAKVIQVSIGQGQGPHISFEEAPLAVAKTPGISHTLTSAELTQGLQVTDAEDYPVWSDDTGHTTALFASVVATALDAGGSATSIDTLQSAVTTVRYEATDTDGNTTVAYRAVVVDDGRYTYVDEDKDGEVDVIIAAKNLVIRQGEIATREADALEQAKARSYVEAYGADGTAIAVEAIKSKDALSQDYLAGVLGAHGITWTIEGHPDAEKAVMALVIPDSFKTDPGIGDRDSTLALIARDFTLNTAAATDITFEPAYVFRADASVITLSGPYAHHDARLIDNGGFKAAQGAYRITFGEAPSGQNKLTLAVTGTVTDGLPPTISYTSPIVVPVASSGTIDVAQLVLAGAITAVDAEDSAAGGAGLGAVAIVDTTTGKAPSFSASQHAVYQIRLSVTDSDGNLVEQLVAVVVQDGNYVIDKDYILRAVDFEIDEAEVSASRPVGQISEQGDVKAWRSDGKQVAASVTDTGGYGSAAGTYHPVVGIYDSNSSTPTVSIVSKQITATVNAAAPAPAPARYRVTFDANGGALTGPGSITVTAPQTTLPYLPSTPLRTGYVFRYWGSAPSGGTQFTVSTQLTTDVTVYAIWEAIPAASTPTVTPPVVNVSYPPSGGNVYITNPAGETVYVEAAPEVTPLEDNRTPLDPVDIDEDKTPLVSEAQPHGWSLFDLVAAILALLVFVIAFMRLVFGRLRDEEYEEEAIDAQLWEAMSPEQRAQYQARREAEFQAWLAARQRRDNKPKALYVNPIVLLVIGLALVGAAVMLFFFQDFTASMSVVDDYSVIFALALLVQILAPLVAGIIYNNRRAAQNQPFFGMAGVDGVGSAGGSGATGVDVTL